MATTTPYFTSTALDHICAPEGTRLEIIAGVLYVSHQPSWHHQYACTMLNAALVAWSAASGLGMSVQVPGLVFPTEEVIPDVVWVSHGRLAGGLDNAGHLRVAPELVVEVTSPGSANIRRDRDVKLDFYDRYGVEEYWIVDPRAQTLDQYQRLGTALVHVRTARVQDTLTTPLLPGFAVRVETLFFA